MTLPKSTHTSENGVKPCITIKKKMCLTMYNHSITHHMLSVVAISGTPICQWLCLFLMVKFPSPRRGFIPHDGSGWCWYINANMTGVY